MFTYTGIQIHTTGCKSVYDCNVDLDVDVNIDVNMLVNVDLYMTVVWISMSM
jgi:hypothetical protein